MKNEFIPYEEALALKDLGFDEPCLGYYLGNTIYLSQKNVSVIGPSGEMPTPLYQQAFRWFRKKHNFNAEIQAPDGSNGKWNPTIHKIKGFGNYYDNDAFETYEEAELECLKKLIEIVNQNKEDE